MSSPRGAAAAAEGSVVSTDFYSAESSMGFSSEEEASKGVECLPVIVANVRDSRCRLFRSWACRDHHLCLHEQHYEVQICSRGRSTGRRCAEPAAAKAAPPESDASFSTTDELDRASAAHSLPLSLHRLAAQSLTQHWSPPYLADREVIRDFLTKRKQVVLH